MGKNKEKGQALIEFVLLLPIIIFLILTVIDIGRILYTKTWLESKMNDVVNLVSSGVEDTNEVEEILDYGKDKISVKLNYSGDKIEINVSKEISFITPGFNRILDNPYHIKIKRIIAND